MRKVFVFIVACVVCVSFLLTAAVADGYLPALGMTFQEFIGKYNAISSPLASPLKALDQASSWSVFNEYDVAWFYPDPNSKVVVLLMSKDKANSRSNNAGLDMIQIAMEKELDYLSFLTVAARCAEVFGEDLDLFGVNLSAQMLFGCMRSYYENDCQAQGLMWTNALNQYETVKVAFFKDSLKWSYFQIYTE